MEAAWMDQIRRMMAMIRTQLGQLNVTHKLLIGSIIVVLAMTLFLVAQYSGAPQKDELLPGAGTADQQRAASYLNGVNIKYEFQNGKLLVAVEDIPRVRSMLAEAGQLPNDKAILFENILQQQSWTNSRQQNEQLYNIALQNELKRTIENFKGVKGATVIIDVPQAQGLGSAVRKATASATVITDSGEPVSQNMVDAVASLIAGARAGLDIERVRVIDSATGRQRKATSEADALPTTYLEHAARVETQTREKVLELLSYIPGVIVAVTAQVDVTRVTANVQTNMAEKQGTVSLIKKQTDTVSQSTEATPGAEPGVGANQTADINRSSGGGGGGSRNDLNESTTEYDNHVGTRSETIVDPKGQPTMVAISVNVPRGFVASLLQQTPAAGAATGAAPEPADAEIADKFAKVVKPAIMETLMVQVRALTEQANANATPDQIRQVLTDSIAVAMIPIDLPAFGPGGSGGAGGGGGAGLASLTGSGLAMSGGLIDKAVLGFLALAALFMMFMMVKRSGRRAEVPSAEELVGVPPALQAQADVMGEAEEGEMAMTGIEVDEDHMHSQKLLEQVGELVSQSPESAAKLINRWIDIDE